MKTNKLLLAAIGLFAASTAFAQIQDEANVTITMDLQPILQLEMTTPDQIDFTFDNIKSYYTGIEKPGATILKVSSSVNWVLYAVGTSNDGVNWDNHVTYTSDQTEVTNAIPLEALELYQRGGNVSTYATGVNFEDYNAPFQFSNLVNSSLFFDGVLGFEALGGLLGQNNIYVSNLPYLFPADGEKYIQGGPAADEFVGPGSWLTAYSSDGSGGAAAPNTIKTPANATEGGVPAGTSNQSPYYIIMDYRIVPGLPATFPFSALNDGTSTALATPAASGVYTMNVKYVLVENW